MPEHAGRVRSGPQPAASRHEAAASGPLAERLNARARARLDPIVQRLSEEGRILNASPKVAAQRAMSGTLNVASQAASALSLGVAPAPASRSSDPVQRMNGQGDDQDEELEFGEFQGAGDHQDGEEDWANFAAFDAPAPELGYGEEVGIGALLSSNGPMFTVGLANCVAVLAREANSDRACLYHWNTIDAFAVGQNDEEEENEEGVRLFPIAEKVVEAKNRVDQDLGAAGTYQIVLGGLWRDSFSEQTKNAFVEGLTLGFPGVAIDAAGHSKARRVGQDLIGYD